jgi:signal transduction histidine kinase/CheY-like chemotaxis protein
VVSGWVLALAVAAISGVRRPETQAAAFRTIAIIGGFAAAITIAVFILGLVLRLLARDVARQGALVAEKESLLEEQSEELRQRAESLEQVNAELKASLERHAETEALLHAALSAAPVGFAFLDRERRFLRVNEWLANASTASVEEHAGRRVDQVNADLAAAILPHYEHVLAYREPQSNVELTVPAPGEQQNPRYWLASFYPIDVEATGFMGVGAVISDVSERKQLEEQFRQSQKMEAIGKLAGGVAHDFNNLLTAISGFSEFALASLPRDHPAREDVEQALHACHRGGALTRQLLAFSRQQVMKPSVLSVNEVVAGIEPLLRRLIGADVSLKLLLDPEIGSIKADKGQLEQVLMNLVVNARDAMPDGGRLSIETGSAMLDDGYVQQGNFRASAGPHVLLRVTDTGDGMDAATRERIFEPFFTTKAPGKGTGLGLSTVYGIVKQSGGSIWVYSEPGLGTTIKIYFPEFEGVAPITEPVREPAAAPRGSGYVLVVDDDEAIRALAVRSLRNAGFETMEAGTGAHGLELARANAVAIRAIVADVMMPGMGGREMMRRLRTLGIDAPVLYVSGWTADAMEMESYLTRGDTFLEKPFSPAALARAVHALLTPSATGRRDAIIADDRGAANGGRAAGRL